MRRRKFVTQSIMGIAASSFMLPSFSMTIANKKVVLIGDSIRIGYQDTVREALDAGMELWSPKENCRTSDYILYKSNDWLKVTEPDIIHMNAGLHDIRTLAFDSPPGQTNVPAEDYRRNLETLFWWLDHYVDCKVIWGTITPVIDELARKAHEKNQDFVRYNSDVIHFNTIAKEVAAKHHIPVNDLYSLVEEKIGEEGFTNDGVHFKDWAQQLQGKQVAQAIKEYITK